LSQKLIQRALTLRYNGARDKGRPRRRWIDDIEHTTVNIIQQIHHMVLSRTLHFHSTPWNIQRQTKERRKSFRDTRVIYVLHYFFQKHDVFFSRSQSTLPEKTPSGVILSNFSRFTLRCEFKIQTLTFIHRGLIFDDSLDCNISDYY
jgi:hypothetical protein